MTRKKKSRKPQAVPTKAAKLDKATLAAKDKKPKKHKGKAPGNRQAVAQQKSVSTAHTSKDKDPRIGSKKPIVLTKEHTPNKQATAPKATTKSAKSANIAAINVIPTGPTIADQIAEIENDSQLQTLIEKLEDDIILTDSEVSYYNDMMDKYEALAEQLEDDEIDEDSQELSEDDLWDKLDNSDLSTFE